MAKVKKRKIIYIIAAAAALLAVIACIVFFATRGDDPAPDSGQTQDVKYISLGSALKLTLVGEYDGVFMEDGSNDEITNALAIVLQNDNYNDLQYAEIYLDYGDFTASFTATNVPSGSSVLLLEKNRTLSKERLPNKYYTENLVFFDEKMSVAEDVFEINGTDGAINIKNISDKDIDGDVVVSYKNYANDMFYGGITYRITVTGGIKAGEMKQAPAGHFSSSSSKVLTATWVDE